MIVILHYDYDSAFGDLNGDKSLCFIKTDCSLPLTINISRIHLLLSPPLKIR